MKLARESMVIAAIGIADLLTTIIFIRHHGAQEANPLFKLYWDMGIGAFITAKFCCLIGPIMVLEWARKRNPVFVGRALRCTIAAYLVMYGVGVAKLNGPFAAAGERSSHAAIASWEQVDRHGWHYGPMDETLDQNQQFSMLMAMSRRHLPSYPLWDPGYSAYYHNLRHTGHFKHVGKLAGARKFNRFSQQFALHTK